MMCRGDLKWSPVSGTCCSCLRTSYHNLGVRTLVAKAKECAFAMQNRSSYFPKRVMLFKLWLSLCFFVKMTFPPRGGDCRRVVGGDKGGGGGGYINPAVLATHMS